MSDLSPAGGSLTVSLGAYQPVTIALTLAAPDALLPNAPNLRLFAMTLTRHTRPETVPAGGPLAQPPLLWANAGPARIVNAASTNGSAVVKLDGSASASPAGTPLSYAWTINGASLATGVYPVVNLSLGTNTVLLTVTDGQGQTAVDATTIIVIPPLTLSVTATPTNSAAAPLTVRFTGQASGGGLADSTDDRRGTITAQGENSGAGEVARNAFDNTTGTKWLDFATASPSTRSTWIQYAHADGMRYIVTGYTVTSANDAGSYPGRNPASWRLLASDDGGASWVTLDTRMNQAFSGSYHKRTYAATNTTAYNLYRLQIDRVADPSIGCMQLDELEFLARTPFYWWSFGDGATSTAQNPRHTYTHNGTYLVTLLVSDGLTTATNTLRLIFAPPALAILAGEAGTLALAWPGQAENCQLHFATNLEPPIIWSPLTNAVIQFNGTNYVNLPIAGDCRFFQLRNP